MNFASLLALILAGMALVFSIIAIAPQPAPPRAADEFWMINGSSGTYYCKGKPIVPSNEFSSYDYIDAFTDEPGHVCYAYDILKLNYDPVARKAAADAKQLQDDQKTIEFTPYIYNRAGGVITIK